MVPPPGSIHRAFVKSCNLYNVIIIYYPPDNGFCRVETYNGVNTNEVFNTIFCVLKIYIETFLKFTKTECNL
jgi:hypothetical protein